MERTMMPLMGRREAEEKERRRRLSKVVRESTDAEEVERARAGLYELITLRSTLRREPSPGSSPPTGHHRRLKRHKRHAAGDAGDEDDDEDTASSITCCREKKRQRNVVPPRIQEGKEDASEPVASHQVGDRR